MDWAKILAARLALFRVFCFLAAVCFFVLGFASLDFHVVPQSYGPEGRLSFPRPACASFLALDLPSFSHPSGSGVGFVPAVWCWLLLLLCSRCYSTRTGLLVGIPSQRIAPDFSPSLSLTPACPPIGSAKTRPTSFVFRRYTRRIRCFFMAASCGRCSLGCA